MIKLRELDEEYDKFEDSLLYISGSVERTVRLEFAKQIEKLITIYPKNSQLYHKLGLCFYNLTDWEEEDKKTIEISFHRALLLDKNSIFSKIFLTHFYYDIGNFNLSLKCNESLSYDSLGNEVPKWRVVKLYGLKLCCLIELKMLKQNQLVKALPSLLNKYSELDEDELAAARPIELFNSITYNFGTHGILNEIALLVDKLKELCGKFQ